MRRTAYAIAVAAALGLPPMAHATAASDQPGLGAATQAGGAPAAAGASVPRAVGVAMAAAVPAPKGVKIHNNYGKFKVSWTKPAGGVYFRLAVAADKAMKKVLYRSKITKQTNAWTKSSRIVEGGTYWVQVQAFDKNHKAGKKSKPKSVTTKSKAPGHLDEVRTQALSDSALRVTWAASAKLATGYKVELAHALGAAPTFTHLVKNAKAAGTDIGGLGEAGFAPGSEFFVTAIPTRYFNRDGGSRTTAAGLPYPTPPGAPAFNATVASYNVYYSAAVDAAGRTWAQRIPALAARMAGADIVGIQEAGGKGAASGVAGPDLAEATGLVRASTGNGQPCSDNRAVDILLNPARFAVTTCAIDPLPAGDNRWLLTVQARELASGAPFIVATTHLLDGKAAADDQPRRVQATAIVGLLAARNPEGLPVIFTGDLNSAEATAVDAAPSIIAAAGYVGADLVARTLQGAQYNTSHGWTQAHQVAEHIDHIMTNAKVAVETFGVHYGDPAGEPSDHFAISANLNVYPS
jgi:endonuclease/exonuclease/phosphatase family metal-dependent hydrolase